MNRTSTTRAHEWCKRDVECLPGCPSHARGGMLRRRLPILARGGAVVLLEGRCDFDVVELLDTESNRAAG